MSSLPNRVSIVRWYTDIRGGIEDFSRLSTTVLAADTSNISISNQSLQRGVLLNSRGSVDSGLSGLMRSSHLGEYDPLGNTAFGMYLSLEKATDACTFCPGCIWRPRPRCKLQKIFSRNFNWRINLFDQPSSLVLSAFVGCVSDWQAFE